MSIESVAGPASTTLSINFPQPLDDATLIWLSANNRGLGFSQTARGELIVTPPTGSLGNRGELLLLNQFVTWNLQTNFGEVRGLTGGVHLPKGGDFDPDVFVICKSDFDAIADVDINRGFLPVLPLVVVELLSPANLTMSGYSIEFEKKLAAYEENGVPLVILLNPGTCTAFIRRPTIPERSSLDKQLYFTELPALVLDAGTIYNACNQR